MRDPYFRRQLMLLSSRGKRGTAGWVRSMKGHLASRPALVARLCKRRVCGRGFNLPPTRNGANRTSSSNSADPKHGPRFPSRCDQPGQMTSSDGLKGGLMSLMFGMYRSVVYVVLSAGKPVVSSSGHVGCQFWSRARSKFHHQQCKMQPTPRSWMF
ncbi:hypothetical protein B0T21DRAFT_346844 [Apiosordaria backusii]|uniref:Uncharacterized protein n=1 Tax=Apiosordaria backusii TaxID=314023 RepID=A0AA40BSH1_9PEZI|nr:hypothetical protein B0T21DRAFT_346844 [Apiosordaria backusii]